MKWHQDVNMDNVIVSGSSYGGPIAIIRDSKKFVKVQGAGKPVIVIYSGSGKQLSSLVVNYCSFGKKGFLSFFFSGSIINQLRLGGPIEKIYCAYRMTVPFIFTI